MRSQISLGSVFGIKIGLHYSWFIIAFLIVLSLSAQFHARNPAWGEGLHPGNRRVDGNIVFRLPVVARVGPLAGGEVAEDYRFARSLCLRLAEYRRSRRDPTSAKSGILDGDRRTVDECRHRSVLSWR